MFASRTVFSLFSAVNWIKVYYNKLFSYISFSEYRRDRFQVHCGCSTTFSVKEMQLNFSVTKWSLFLSGCKSLVANEA